ncbi:MAG: pseudouridine synthase [Flavobacteriales bacterium AspAUS03]
MKKVFRKHSQYERVPLIKKEPLVRSGSLYRSNGATTIRLNRYLAHAGLASRREADELIKTGMVEINGKVITELGYKILPTDRVKFDGRYIFPEKKVYILLNKPKGFITTTQDEKGRRTVMDLVAKASSSRIYPVGRLDRQTTGVLLLTNDGNLVKKLTHPKYQVKKIYHVVLHRKLEGADLEKIKKGIYLAEGKVQIDAISYVQNAKKNELGIELHIGWNRVIRRVFETLDYEVTRLDRVSFGGLTKKNVKRGQWRTLTQKEIHFLKIF